MEQIRCDDKRVHILEGFGGNKITTWRVHEIISLYIAGEATKAKEQYIDWYWSQLRKYATVPKRHGGMYRGTLFRLIHRAHRVRGLRFTGQVDRANAVIIQDCIENQVNKRFALVDSVVSDGYSPRSKAPIAVVPKQGLYYLLEGHHRVATLNALGWYEVPGVYCFNNEVLFRLWSATKRFLG